jgi:hypothetical protein
MEVYPIAWNQRENSSQHLLIPVYYYTKQPNCTMKSKTDANKSSQMLGKCNNLTITLIKIVLLPYITNILRTVTISFSQHNYTKQCFP